MNNAGKKFPANQAVLCWFDNVNNCNKMNNKAKNSHQDTWNPAGSKIGLGLATNVSDEEYGITLDFTKNHGVSAIAVACSDYYSMIVEHPVKVSLRTLTGFKPLNFAVRMMVIMIETLRFPRSVIFPKVILRNKIAFLMHCSPGLLFGVIIGYSMNTNSSSLKVINSFAVLLPTHCNLFVLKFENENTLKHVRDKPRTRVGGHFQSNMDYQLCQYSYQKK